MLLPCPMQVLTALVTCLSRQDAQHWLPTLLTDVFSASGSCAAACQLACLQPDTLARLAAKLGPQMFLARVHPELLQFLCSAHADGGTPHLSQASTHSCSHHIFLNKP